MRNKLIIIVCVLIVCCVIVIIVDFIAYGKIDKFTVPFVGGQQIGDYLKTVGSPNNSYLGKMRKEHHWIITGCIYKYDVVVEYEDYGMKTLTVWADNRLMNRLRIMIGDHNHIVYKHLSKH